MHQHGNDIYVSAPLRRLREAQARVLMPELQRCVGAHALLLSAVRNDTPPALPMLGCWVHLCLDQDGYAGDLRAAADEPLPFVDDAFELVLLNHALEVSPATPALLLDAIRVLAPGGLLALTGVHPVSGWTPWLRWQCRGQSLSLQLPLQLQRLLRQAGLDIELTQRVGRGWPGQPTSCRASSNAFGGGYVLIARKHRRQGTPLRIKPVNLPVPTGRQLSPGTRRSAALRTTGKA
ncbi:MAG TPA: methyltransferase domain-containing protein [Rhodanobacter sp.]|nr:methyltransferase domain-containing protein [Rhodanobacter sp.]